MVLSYIVGQKKNPIPYPMQSIATYVLMTVILAVMMNWCTEHFDLGTIGQLVCNNICILFFLSYILYNDLPAKNLPIIGKYFKH